MDTPTTCNKQGAYTPDAIEYYINIARGGTVLLITGANWVENDIEKHNSYFFPCPTIRPAGEMTDRIHAFGSKLFLQLTAGLGRSAYPLAIKGSAYVAPSATDNLWDYKDCRELTTEEIEIYPE